MCLADVARPYGSSKTIVTIVGTRNDFLWIGERHRRDHWSEDFFADDLHLLLRIHKNRGLDKVSAITRLTASDNGFRAFGEPCFEIAANTIQLLFGDERSHLRIGFESRSDFDFLGLFGNSLDDLIENRFLDIQP